MFPIIFVLLICSCKKSVFNKTAENAFFAVKLRIVQKLNLRKFLTPKFELSDQKRIGNDLQTYWNIGVTKFCCTVNYSRVI